MNALNSRLTIDSEQAFDTDGVLARHIKGYSARTVQKQMASAVCSAINGTSNLVVEAGTGVGKTYAYLIPALLSGKQIIVSTGSKNLQEQLFYKDLPALLDMLVLAPKLALLKGRSNYLCQLLLEQQLVACESHEPKVLDDLLRINQWSGQTVDGDLGGLNSVSENSDALRLIASQREKCTGNKCAHYAACFTRKARVRAMDAKIIVVNHHLFFADRILKETGFAELLPDSDVVIFDEAHLLPDIAVTYFGQQISTRSLDNVLQQIIAVYQTELRDSAQIELLAARSINQLNRWHQQLFDTDETDWRLLMGNRDIASASWAMIEELKSLEVLLFAHLGRSETLDECIERLVTLSNKLSVFFQCENNQAAYSIDYGYRYLTLSIAPINVAKECEKLFDAQTSWIFTSATLQINRDLSLFTKGLGIDKSKQIILASPFDYRANALLCVPRHLSKVSNHEAAVKQLIDVSVMAINAAKGRTFILFTSHRMMNAVAARLQSRVNYPLLVQGQGSKQSLMKKFRQLGNAVLLGTGAFWEGVDVRGKRLSCVIIDKLPFVSPSDTLYRARAESVSRDGRDPFTMLSLPQAVISLNQGVGRLIRDEKDKGVLILCDNRIVNREYGQAFLNSLPPMSRTRDMDKVVNFLEQIK
ncbi:ATP-dependent DNA helicase [Shewanella eurypsychrophilus]|uniref:ATP-dependent DNA helicase n=1 Tax=Shewanella eurypsychrophilus TaxID=2593656 RepID=A0ABX6V5B4_9GAMM|nr:MULTISPECIES: ATP-dependent DNA helicase [Shewanella]QFU22536.1 DEAD/DEAH box helicase [Shewanella sp. YLB-09]QPG57824.1 ATP-dependent DNA helicase [Shewanella eurypsychrophilus]